MPPENYLERHHKKTLSQNTREKRLVIRAALYAGDFLEQLFRHPKRKRKSRKRTFYDDDDLLSETFDAYGEELQLTPSEASKSSVSPAKNLQVLLTKAQYLPQENIEEREEVLLFNNIGSDYRNDVKELVFEKMH